MTTSPELKWTPEQSTFFHALSTTTSSIILTAVAGSGKTTTLIEGTNHLRGSILAVAFNVKIKKALEEKIGRVALCKTMNGLGHSALGRMLSRRIIIDANKTRKLLKKALGEKKWEDLWPQFSTISNLVAKAKHHGIVPDKLSASIPPNSALLPDDEESWQGVADHYDLDLTSAILSLTRRILRQSIEDTFTKAICDFNDQIYIPICFGAAFDKFDNILVDEAQDLSEIQHRMLKKALRLSGRVIAVGDPFQAIYGFRGAKNDSIERLRETFSMEEMSLTVSFRCAKSIVAEAQSVVPIIQPSPSSPAGSVNHLREWYASDFAAGDMILCRNNAPIITAAYRLISRGHGVHVLGRDIGAGLKALVTRLVGKRDATIIELQTALDEWFKREEANASAKDQIDKIATLHDKYESLTAVINYSGTSSVFDLLSSIDTLFGRESAPITLGSIHRSKGMEWPRVFFLDSFLIPSKHTTRAYAKDPERYEWMLQEEKNILYVGITRAQEELNYILTEDFEKIDFDSLEKKRAEQS